jgi:hypothetical protein
VAKVPSKKSATAKVTTPSSKTHAASLSFNEEIELLLQLASAAPVLKFPERKSAAKLYELAVLAELLLEFQVTGGTVALVQPRTGKPCTFAGSPASANKDLYAWFDLRDPSGAPIAEAWVSVQFVGLSATLAKKHLPHAWVNEKASSHELDLSLLAPEAPGAARRRYPNHLDLLAGVSVKHVSSLAKESIREALGFRREMGLLRGPGMGSLSPWLQGDVPCEPPSPLFLASSAEDFQGYDGHIDQLGIYAVFMKFPY